VETWTEVTSLHKASAMLCVILLYNIILYTIINYGIIFWGNSSYSSNIFELQKRIIRIIEGIGIRDSFRVFFKILNILPPISQYIFPLVLLVVNNKNQFRMNSEIHSNNTRNNYNFH